MFSWATIVAFLLKNWWKVGLGIIVATALSVIVLKVHGYLKHVSDVEAQNKSLITDNATLTAQKEDLVKLNAANAATHASELAQQQADHEIASNESAATTARAQTYKEINNAISTAPKSTVPVDPVIRNTIDSVLRSSSNQGAQ